MDRVQHIATGGRWKDLRTGEWQVASTKLLRYIIDHPVHAALLGLPSRTIREPGGSNILCLHVGADRS